MPFVIDIDPVAFTLLGLSVRWYGLILVVAAAVAICLAQREGQRRGIAPGVVSDAVIWVGLAALVGGRLLYLGDEPAVLFGLKTAQLIGLGIAAFAVTLFIVARRAGRPTTARLSLEASRP